MAKNKQSDFESIVELAKELSPTLTQSQREAVIRALVLTAKPAEEPGSVSPYEPGKLYRFNVINGDVSDEIVASNEIEAWALMCDKIKRWPGKARSGQVTCLGEIAEAVESPIADLPPVADLPPINGVAQAEAPAVELASA